MHALFAPSDVSAVPIVPLKPGDTAAWLSARDGAVANFARTMDFRGQAGRILIVPGTDGAIERILFGLGEHPSALLFGALSKDLPGGDYKLSGPVPGIDPTQIATAWLMGAYAFTRYKRKEKTPARLALPDGADAEAAERTSAAVFLVRDLVNTPAQDLGPVALEAAARAVASAYGAELSVVVGDDLLAQNYPAIHAVGRAAHEAPRHVRLVWGEADAPRLALVGKGVCFDSGGLNIKPESGMRNMKKDMGGAAHALALAQLVMARGLKVRLSVDLAIVENAIGAGAFRPGDILSSRKGLTIEIENTDAEGRLILADALARACEDEPELVIDFATLTGAARVALGAELPPFYTDDEALAADINAAAKEVSDPCWRMPLWPGYEGEIEAGIADLRNTGATGLAGSVTAALFLKRFVSAPSWVHLDVFAWNPKDAPARPAGGEAQTLRLFERLLTKRYGG
jgi:leucyl aminopeptidase